LSSFTRWGFKNGGECSKTGGPRRRSRRDLVGLPLSRIDTFDDLLPGLGPPRSNQRMLCLAAGLTQTVDRDAACRGRASIDALSGFPTGRPWVSLASRRLFVQTCISEPSTIQLSRTLLPRIRRMSRRLTPAFPATWVRRPAQRDTLCPRGRFRHVRRR
jgi:hypothetical protein